MTHSYDQIAKEKLLNVYQSCRQSARGASTDNKWRWTRGTVYVVVTLGILIFAISTGVVASIMSGTAKHYFNPDRIEFHCGNSAAEAKAQGCKFDIMEFAWVHPACWDQELLDEFAPPNRWTFALDQDRLIPVSQTIAETGAIESFWVASDYHGAHCTYCFHKMTKAVAQRLPVNVRNRHMRHTNHCSESIRTISAGQSNNSAVGGVNYLRCRSSYPR